MFVGFVGTPVPAGDHNVVIACAMFADTQCVAQFVHDVAADNVIRVSDGLNFDIGFANGKVRDASLVRVAETGRPEDANFGFSGIGGKFVTQAAV